MSLRPVKNLFGLSLAGIEELVTAMGEPKFRAGQIYSWLYAKRTPEIVAMTNLSAPLRAALVEQNDLRWIEVADRQFSEDGTIKSLYRLDDGAAIESVYIPETRRQTICISTQAGCPLKCAFCLTGISGYKRNLKPWEILSQVADGMDQAKKASPRDERPWNVVVMGMGEPLLNYENTMSALRILMDPKGFAITPKKLTLSTVGILPALEKLKLEPVRPNLAISLHAPTSKLRGELMPIEHKYALKDVIEAADSYPSPRGGRVTYEYVLLKDVNDRDEHAHALARLLRGRNGKVNLIPLNAAEPIPFDTPRQAQVARFEGILLDAGVPVSVRKPRGQDVLAACGQLRMKKMSPAC
ncbi:MAG: 23S rRNA (adenine(2503)-C(2))-methyltransferase RlmN [Vicinamibacteria bacterium]|nr:23S rRNA (adenine(2503)-C(2))-methyltransferase RlmN [Vicinamibacteria bacterium]